MIGLIEFFLLIMVFVVVFGFLMDYEVFLVSCMHEEWMKTCDVHYVVCYGLVMIGCVVMVVVIIMIVVFGAFVIGNERVLVMMGVGFVVVIFIDVFIIWLFLLFVVMYFVGLVMWWMLLWLEKCLLYFNIERFEVL